MTSIMDASQGLNIYNNISRLYEESKVEYEKSDYMYQLRYNYGYINTTPSTSSNYRINPYIVEYIDWPICLEEEIKIEVKNKQLGWKFE